MIIWTPQNANFQSGLLTFPDNNNSPAASEYPGSEVFTRVAQFEIQWKAMSALFCSIFGHALPSFHHAFAAGGWFWQFDTPRSLNGNAAALGQVVYAVNNLNTAFNTIQPDTGSAGQT